LTDLRDYQMDAVEELKDAAKAIYVLPTGGGKTVIAAHVIERARWRGERVLVLTHRREILKQTSLSLPIEHGLILAGLNIDLEYPVQIASVQTLWARCMRTDKVPLPPADLIIIDECHHVAARTWLAILAAYPNARRIGLTATPCRGDGRGLGNYFSQIIEGPQVAELIERKYLVPTIYYAPAEPDLRGVETRQGDYAVGQLSDRMNRDDLIGDIVSNWHKLGQRRKTLVFCVDVAHSVHVKDEFLKSGVRAEHVDGSTPKPDRDAALTRLASGETELISNCIVLTEGFDLPAIGCIVLARPTKQLGLFRQMAGRGLRPAPGKSNLILVDHSGAVYRHGLLEDSGRVDARRHQARQESDPRRARPRADITPDRVQPMRSAAQRRRAVSRLRLPAQTPARRDRLSRRRARPRRPQQSSAGALVRPERAHALARHAGAHRRRARLQARMGGLQVQGKIWHLAGVQIRDADRADAGSAVVGAQPPDRLRQGSRKNPARIGGMSRYPRMPQGRDHDEQLARNLAEVIDAVHDGRCSRERRVDLIAVHVMSAIRNGFRRGREYERQKKAAP
jgi:DNA repair protein RadD